MARKSKVSNGLLKVYNSVIEVKDGKPIAFYIEDRYGLNRASLYFRDGSGWTKLNRDEYLRLSPETIRSGIYKGRYAIIR